MDMKELPGSFQRIYGEKEGLRIFMTVMPGILKDFNSMLKTSLPGKRITEEYIVEDGKAKVLLSGTAGKEGPEQIQARVIRNG